MVDLLSTKIRKGITQSHLVKSKKIITNLTIPYFILVTFQTCFFSPFSSFNDEKRKVQVLQYANCNENGNVQSHDQEESILNCIINANSGANTLTHDKMIKSPFNKNNLATINSK